MLPGAVALPVVNPIDSPGAPIMPNEYRPAPEVAEIARQLITRVEQHHPLVDAHLEYVFVGETPKSRGHEIWGRARKLAGLQAWLSNPEFLPHTAKAFTEPSEYFLIEIAWPVWGRLSDGQKAALVDHELSHCAVGRDDDGELKLSLRHHDVEEFVGVVQRNGLWSDSTRWFAGVAGEQLSLIDANLGTTVVGFSQEVIDHVAAEMGGTVSVVDGVRTIHIDADAAKPRRGRRPRATAGATS